MHCSDCLIDNTKDRDATIQTMSRCTSHSQIVTKNDNDDDVGLPLSLAPLQRRKGSNQTYQLSNLIALFLLLFCGAADAQTTSTSLQESMLFKRGSAATFDRVGTLFLPFSSPVIFYSYHVSCSSRTASACTYTNCC